MIDADFLFKFFLTFAYDKCFLRLFKATIRLNAQKLCETIEGLSRFKEFIDRCEKVQLFIVAR